MAELCLKTAPYSGDKYLFNKIQDFGVQTRVMEQIVTTVLPKLWL